MQRSGIELAGDYHRDVLAPILAERWPTMPYAAARLGSGSDVLGLDDETSRDHDWGLRLTLLVPGPMVEEVQHHLAEVVPEEYAGHPTRFPLTWQPDPALAVEVATASAFASSRLGIDVDHEWTTDDWLSVTGQAILEVTAGPVFVDTEGALTAIRERLSWYPDDVWRWVVAADWTRIGDEFPFVGRTGVRGDDVGSRIIAARIARSIMHLGFLLERRWPPYSKWIGSVFATLPRAGGLAPILAAALAAPTWREREAALVRAVEAIADLQRTVGMPVPDPVTEPFYDRPFGAVTAVDEAVIASMADRVLAARIPRVGSIEQWCDATASLLSPDWRRRS